MKHLPGEILPGDLIAGGRFNIQTSTCLSRRGGRGASTGSSYGKGGTREQVKWFHDHGYGNAGRHQRPPDPGLRRGILLAGLEGRASRPGGAARGAAEDGARARRPRSFGR